MNFHLSTPLQFPQVVMRLLPIPEKTQAYGKNNPLAVECNQRINVGFGKLVASCL
jgi:hypothetical protein